MAQKQEFRQLRSAALTTDRDGMTANHGAQPPSGEHEIRVGASPGPVPVLRLACTACQLVHEPDLADFGNGNTGCPQCGGWTWIAQLNTSPTAMGGED
jgi:PHP family Zn ribbon phosphoesterase